MDSDRKTPFSAWREAVGFEREEAADYLGLTPQMVLFLDRGITSNGRPAVPRVSTRKLMFAAYKGLDLKPWPV